MSDKLRFQSMIDGPTAQGSPRTESELDDGTWFAGYRLRRWLAQGGMAELFIAQPDRAPNSSTEVVVLKRILPQFAQDPAFARMFAREAQLALALRHPNIVEVYDSGGSGAHDCYLAMEYVHGIDLARLVREMGEREIPFPLAHALTIVASACAGLHHAHELTDTDGQPLAIVHRDVSPANVLLAFDGGVKIADFGVAKAMALTSFTQVGTRKGKLSYMSPEQARAGVVDRRSDVFALGAVLYELTTGIRMFGGDNELAILHQLFFRQRPRPTEFIERYPPGLEAIILRATAGAPSERYPSAAELGAAITAFARDYGLELSNAALGGFLGEVLDPPPHPRDDPEFGQGPVRLHGDETVPDALTSGTFPFGSPAGPMSVASGPHASSSPSAQVRRIDTASDRRRQWGQAVGLSLAGVICAGLLVGFVGTRSPRASTPAAVVTPAAVTSPVVTPSVVTPPVVTPPVALPPAHPVAAASGEREPDAFVAVPGSAHEPDPVVLGSDVATPAAAPVKTPRKRARRHKSRSHRRPRAAAVDRTTQPTAHDAPPRPPPPPPPPPPSRPQTSREKSPTETLLPIVGD